MEKNRRAPGLGVAAWLVAVVALWGCGSPSGPPGVAARGADDDGRSVRALSTADITFSGGEMLGQPTDQAVTVKAIASQAVEAYVELGRTSGSYDATTVPATFADGIVQIVISGLAPSTRYVYHLRYRAAGTTDAFAARPEYSLQTQRAKGATFPFAIQSDSHLGWRGFNDPTLYGVTMANIVAGGPDFLLDLGDAVTTDDATETATTVNTKYAAQRAYFEIPGHAAAIFLVLGNHENEEGWNLDDFGADLASSLPVLGANARKRYFVNPVPNAFYTGNSDPLASLDGDHLRGDYYAFTWGDALFVAIDPYWYTMTKPYAGATGGEKNDETVGTRWDWTLGAQQYAWLKQTLEGSHASFKFIFAHQEVGGVEDYGRGGALGAKYCEWGGTNLDGTTSGWSANRSGWASPIHALMVENHVTAFFHGHDHVYAKETLDGVVYQEVPMAANAGYDTGFASNGSEYAGATLLPNSGHLRVTVAPTGATVDYVRSFLAGEGTNGAIAATYVMGGCTADTDGDGTHDCYDGCPADPLKVAPGTCGCGVVDSAADVVCAGAGAAGAPGAGGGIAGGAGAGGGGAGGGALGGSPGGGGAGSGGTAGAGVMVGGGGTTGLGGGGRNGRPGGGRGDAGGSPGSAGGPDLTGGSIGRAGGPGGPGGDTDRAGSAGIAGTAGFPGTNDGSGDDGSSAGGASGDGAGGGLGGAVAGGPEDGALGGGTAGVLGRGSDVAGGHGGRGAATSPGVGASGESGGGCSCAYGGGARGGHDPAGSAIVLVLGAALGGLTRPRRKRRV